MREWKSISGVPPLPLSSLPSATACPPFTTASPQLLHAAPLPWLKSSLPLLTPFLPSPHFFFFFPKPGSKEKWKVVVLSWETFEREREGGVKVPRKKRETEYFSKWREKGWILFVLKIHLESNSNTSCVESTVAHLFYFLHFGEVVWAYICIVGFWRGVWLWRVYWRS